MTKKRLTDRVLCALTPLAFVTAPTHAQWTITNLHPAGATRSEARSVFGAQQVGAATVSGFGHAGLWNGTAASWVDLHPAGATISEARSTSGTQQVGYAIFGLLDHAVLWSGTAASYVDLHPAGSTGPPSPESKTPINGGALSLSSPQQKSGRW